MNGDRYAQLRDRLARAVRTVCPPWLRDREDDLVQAGMMAIMRVARGSEEEREFPSSYLRRVAYSALVDEIRRLRSRNEVPLETMTSELKTPATKRADPERLHQGHEIGEAIRECLKRLIEPRRIAVTLHLLGYGKPQIAERLGWNSKRARNLVFRGLENLRACLREREITP